MTHQTHLIAEINIMSLRLALHSAKIHDYLALEAFCLDDQTIDDIKSLNAEQLDELSNFAGMMVNIQFNPRAVKLGIKHIRKKQLESEFIDELIGMGAPFTLLEQHLAISKGEFTARRKRLKLKEQFGRPELPNEDQARQIDDEWGCFCDNTDDLTRYYQISKATNIPIKTIQAHAKSNFLC